MVNSAQMEKGGREYPVITAREDTVLKRALRADSETGRIQHL